MLTGHPQAVLSALVVACILDALFGEPDWLYRRVPHPIVMVGRLVCWLEVQLLGPRQSGKAKRQQGVVLVVVIVAVAGLVGTLLHIAAGLAGVGSWVIEAVLMASLLAARSLDDHVAAVADGLDLSLDDGRQAVARIVGRDPQVLDDAAVSRAAIESCAENLSDGVVAPLLWGLVFGLPGMLAYKAINTMDSMIGHRSERYLDFGWAAARLDDFVNLPASRLAGFLAVLATGFLPGARAGDAWRAMLRDAPKHRSPNAGWPEASFAGALNLRLAGPRRYGGVMVEDAWMGDGRADATAADIRRAVWLMRAVMALCVSLLALLLAAMAAGSW